ncbi:hypothetical protein QOT17_006075 [Balamuthia mandrillaris]
MKPRNKGDGGLLGFLAALEHDQRLTFVGLALEVAGAGGYLLADALSQRMQLLTPQQSNGLYVFLALLYALSGWVWWRTSFSEDPEDSALVLMGNNSKSGRLLHSVLRRGNALFNLIACLGFVVTAVMALLVDEEDAEDGYEEFWQSILAVELVSMALFVGCAMFSCFEDIYAKYWHKPLLRRGRRKNTIWTQLLHVAHNEVQDPYFWVNVTNLEASVCYCLCLWWLLYPPQQDNYGYYYLDEGEDVEEAKEEWLMYSHALAAHADGVFFLGACLAIWAWYQEVITFRGHMKATGRKTTIPPFTDAVRDASSKRGRKRLIV